MTISTNKADPIAQAAEAILHLINSKPRNPTKDEIVAIIAKAMMPAPDVGTPKFRAESDASHVAMMSVNVRCKALKGNGASAVRAAEDEARAAARRLDACATRIAKAPIRSPADLLLLSEVIYCFFVQLNDEPDDIEDEREKKAALALIKGVRELTWGGGPPPIAED
jgi:hypothetical protein